MNQVSTSRARWTMRKTDDESKWVVWRTSRDRDGVLRKATYHRLTTTTASITARFCITFNVLSPAHFSPSSILPEISWNSSGPPNPVHPGFTTMHLHAAISCVAFLSTCNTCLTCFAWDLASSADAAANIWAMNVEPRSRISAEVAIGLGIAIGLGVVMKQFWNDI